HGIASEKSDSDKFEEGVIISSEKEIEFVPVYSENPGKFIKDGDSEDQTKDINDSEEYTDLESTIIFHIKVDTAVKLIDNETNFTLINVAYNDKDIILEEDYISELDNNELDNDLNEELD